MKRSSFLIVTAAAGAATAAVRNPVRAALRPESVLSNLRIRADRAVLRGAPGGCASRRRSPRDPAMAGYTLADVL